jgi:hypothetical protein
MLQTENAFVIHIENKVLNTSDLHKEKLTFEGFNIVIIEIFKFQKCVSICMMAQTLIMHHLNSLIWKKISNIKLQ